MDRSKDVVAQRLAEAHYAVEPGIELIIQLVASPDREADPTEPIKLLEVNQNTTADGVHPVFFGALRCQWHLLSVRDCRGNTRRIRADSAPPGFSCPTAGNWGVNLSGWHRLGSNDLLSRVASCICQAVLADLCAREKLLEHSDLPDCQQLHFLQMACEKLCKAYLCGHGSDPETLRSSHAYIGSTLPIIARQQFAQDWRKVRVDRTWVIQALRALARKIEMLAPAVNDGGRQPANCEYPWAGPDGVLRVPAEHNFELDLLHEKAGRHLLKVLYTAAEELLGVRHHLRLFPERPKEAEDVFQQRPQRMGVTQKGRLALPS